MLHNCLVNANLNFHKSLLNIDIEIAKTTKEQGCRHCGGTLHQANYPRIGFGLSPQLKSLYDTKFSFCCSNCRRRATPPSVRFMGRRRYSATLFVLLCSSGLCPSDSCCERLAKRFGFHLSSRT